MKDSKQSNKVYPLVVSTDHQSAGQGRRGTKWIQYSNSLAFSFTLKPNSQLSLTSAEVSTLLSRYFTKFNIRIELKWPNDLIFHDKKCGGIIINQLPNTDYCIVGVGLNINSEDISSLDFSFPAISLSLPLSELELKQLPLDIYQYLLENRFDNATELTEAFDTQSIHRGKQVQVIDQSEEIFGRYMGLSSLGEAILELPDGQLVKVQNGSLRLI